MRLAYLRVFSPTLPTYHATEDGPDLIISAGRIGASPGVDAGGNPVMDELVVISTTAATHALIAEWPGYEQLPGLEIVDATA